MQERLTLPGPAFQVAAAAMLFELGNMSADGAPPRDLPGVVGAPAAQVIAAVPLKPAAWVFVIDPALGAPGRQWLRGVDAKEIQFRIMPFAAQPSVAKPVSRELGPSIGQVLATEDA